MRTQVLGVSRPARAGGARAREAAQETKEPPKGLGPCLAYLFVEFSRPMAWMPPLALIRPGMIVALWGFGVVLFRRRRPIPRPLWYMFGFIALMTWHVPWAVNNRWALWGLEDYSILVLGCVLPLAVLPYSVAAVRYLLSAYVFFHIPMAIHGLLNKGRGLTGWMGDENDLALALNAAIGLAIFLVYETTSRRKKLFLLASIGVMVAAVAATQSRGGFVGLAALGAYLLVVGPHRSRILLIVLLAGVVLLLFAPADYWDEVRSIRTAAEPGETGEQRMYFWGIGWRMFLDHPIAGVGTRNFGIRAPEYEHWERAHLGGLHIWGRVAHSLYFTLLPEQGTIGVLLFVGVVGWCFRAWWRLRRQARRRLDDASARSAGLLASGVMAGIMAVLLTGAFLSVLYYPIHWVLIGLMGALHDTALGAHRNLPGRVGTTTSDGSRTGEEARDDTTPDESDWNPGAVPRSARRDGPPRGAKRA